MVRPASSITSISSLSASVLIGSFSISGVRAGPESREKTASCEQADTVKSLKRPACKRELCSLGETLLGGIRAGHPSDRGTRIRRLPSLPDVESEQEHKPMILHPKVRRVKGNPPALPTDLPSDDAPGIEEGTA